MAGEDAPRDHGGGPSFSYQVIKDGRVRILWQGRAVVTLRGPRAERFLGEAQGADDPAIQLLAARFTGNFKRGNERVRAGEGISPPRPTAEA